MQLDMLHSTKHWQGGNVVEITPHMYLVGNTLVNSVCVLY